LTELYFEDFHPGQSFDSVYSYRVTAAEIKQFGQRYDPQPFHLDEAAGRSTFFHGLAASGWLTAAIAMRLRVQLLNVAGGMIGAGVEQMRWTKPVRPDDSIRKKLDVESVRPSASRPSLGVVRTRTAVFNQHHEVVMHCDVSFLAPLKNSLP
jgi:acyl dehydratase